MILHLKNFSNASQTAFKGWKAKDPFHESAVIAYYAIFSLPGLLVVIMTSAGFFLGGKAVSNQIATQITMSLGAETAGQVQDMITKASEAKNSLWAAMVAVVTIIIAATGVFAEFQKSLNKIWEVETDKSKSGIWHIIRVRLFSFGLILSIAFILIVSLVVSSTFSALGKWLSARFSDSLSITLQVGNSVATLIILAGLFALMYKFLPDAKIKWRHVWVGSIVTALLFTIGKFALGFYFGVANPGTGYGVAGSVILIMLWVSYSSMIVLYGAEFTHAYASTYAEKVPPTEIAKSISPQGQVAV